MNLGSEDGVAKHRSTNFHVFRDVLLPDTRTGAQTLHIGQILRGHRTCIEQALGAIIQGDERLLEALEGQPSLRLVPQRLDTRGDAAHAGARHAKAKLGRCLQLYGLDRSQLTSVGSIHHRPRHAFPESHQKPARFAIDEVGETLGWSRPGSMLRRGAAVPNDPDVVKPHLLSTVEHDSKIVPAALSKLHASGTLGRHGAGVPPPPGKTRTLQIRQQVIRGRIVGLCDDQDVWCHHRQLYCSRLTRGKAMSMPSTLVSAGVVSMFALVRGDVPLPGLAVL